MRMIRNTLVATTIAVSAAGLWLALSPGGETVNWIRLEQNDNCLLINRDAPELRDVHIHRRGVLTAQSFVVDFLPEHDSDGMSLSFNLLQRSDEAPTGTPPTNGGQCQFDPGPFGFGRQRDGRGVCGVGPHRDLFVRNAGSRSYVRVSCTTPSGRCSMTVFEQAPPLQFSVFLAMGQAPAELWQTLEARTRAFVSQNVVSKPDCNIWRRLLLGALLLAPSSSAPTGDRPTRRA